MEMWRYYVELFVLVLIAFAIGSAVAIAYVRIRVKDRAQESNDSSGGWFSSRGTTGGPR